MDGDGQIADSGVIRRLVGCWCRKVHYTTLPAMGSSLWEGVDKLDEGRCSW